MDNLSTTTSKELTEAQLLQECRNCENRMIGGMIEFISAKFDRGLLLHDTVFKERKYGAGLMDKLVSDLREAGVRVSDATLYKEHAFAEKYSFDKESLFFEVDQMVERGISVNYGILCKELNSPAAVGGMKNHANIAAKKIEDLGNAVADAIEVHSENPEVMAAAGAGTEVLREGAEWLLGNTLQPGLTLQEPTQLPHYLAWIRQQWPLDVPGTPGIYPGPVEAHHLILKARGNAALDIFTVPLTPDGHRRYHATGHRSFEAEFGLDLRSEALLLIQRYIQQHP